VRIEVENTRIILQPADRADERICKELRDATAYKLEGAQFDIRYQLGQWDGKRRLVVRGDRRSARERNPWFAPVGLLEDILDLVGDCEVIDNRRPLGKTLQLKLRESVIPALRDYQEDAVEVALLDNGILTGKGMLRLPTRSGKTVIAAAIIVRLGVRTLFIVPSRQLLNQTVAFFKKTLHTAQGGMKEVGWTKKLVGQYGDDVYKIGWVTVACVQSLVARANTKDVQRLFSEVDLVFTDEHHHMRGDEWRRMAHMADARYKLGLSATIYVDRESPMPDESITMVASTGPILYDLEASDLIERGWLCRPTIRFLRAADPDEIDEDDQFHTLYKYGVSENGGRNAQIADAAFRHVLEGQSVLVTLSRLNHVRAVKVALKARSLSVAVIVGKTPAKQRELILEAFRERKLDVLIGTVFNEGVDLPFLDVVIVGDAMASKILTVQRLRNLTPWDAAKGKVPQEPMDPPDEVIVYDFADMCSKILARHSRERLTTYREQRAFRIEWKG